MLAYVCWWFSSWASRSAKGVARVSNSHSVTPNDQKSTSVPWPDPATTSGAMNSGLRRQQGASTRATTRSRGCLLYTSDAADDM
eukprot:2891912-Prymnesium_polylepis.1